MVEGFKNREEYGFEEGHIYGLFRMHNEYVSGGLSHKEALVVERHLRRM